MRPVEGETAGYMADRPIGRPKADKGPYRTDRSLSALQGPTGTYVADTPSWRFGGSSPMGAADVASTSRPLRGRQVLIGPPKGDY